MEQVWTTFTSWLLRLFIYNINLIVKYILTVILHMKWKIGTCSRLRLLAEIENEFHHQMLIYKCIVTIICIFWTCAGVGAKISVLEIWMIYGIFYGGGEEIHALQWRTCTSTIRCAWRARPWHWLTKIERMCWKENPHQFS